MSFSPKEITKELKKFMPNLNVSYSPDYRQKIADTWPKSINDSNAKEDWNWSPEYNLEKLTETMYLNLEQVLVQKK